MNTINAIAKVRFASAKPQRVQLSKGEGLVVDLLCFEAGQSMEIAGGSWSYYVIAGTVSISGDAPAAALPAGQLAVTEPGEKHTLANSGEGRAIILACGQAK